MPRGPHRIEADHRAVVRRRDRDGAHLGVAGERPREALLEPLEAARRLLAERARITATELAVLHGEDEEVVDSRDFLLGADHGGLVVALPRGRIGRAPYLFPYVDPTVRASVRPSRSHAFAIETWRLNAELFAGSGLRVRDLPPAARLDLGDGLLEDVCRAHARRIEELAPLP